MGAKIIDYIYELAEQNGLDGEDLLVLYMLGIDDPHVYDPLELVCCYISHKEETKNV